MEKYLDCLGEMCPVPLLKARAELEHLAGDDVLLISTDHSCVARSLQENFGKKGYKVRENEVMNGIWEITVSKA